MKPRPHYDMVIIGGGTGGLVAALIAAGAGARVALVERARTGGDCLWTGCVPSKALIAAANLAHRMRHADAVGLAPREPEIYFAQVMDHVHGAQRRIAPQDSVERLRREGVEVIEADSRFLGPGRIQAGDRVLSWRTAIIATGSEPSGPPIPGLDEAGPLTTENLWGAVGAAAAPRGAWRRPHRLRARAGVRTARQPGDAGRDGAAAAGA